MLGLRQRLSSPRSHASHDLDLRPVDELHDETRSLPVAERLFSEVDDEYRQMEADHAEGVASD